MFHEGNHFNNVVQNIMPMQADLYKSFILRMRDIIWAVLVGNFFVALLQGVAITIGLLISGIPSPVLWGVVAAIFSLVPVIGTGVIWLPAAFYLAFIENSYSYAIFIAIYGESMFLLLENIVKPLMMNKKVGLHPLFLFLAIVGGITEFGISGIFVGPLAVTVFLTLWTILKLWLEEVKHHQPIPLDQDSQKDL
jgi:predicted PurR-regulated permease PerM